MKSSMLLSFLLLCTTVSHAGEYFFIENAEKMREAYNILSKCDVVRPEGFLNTGFFKNVKNENLGSYRAGPYLYKQKGSANKIVLFLNPSKATRTDCAAIIREVGDGSVVSSTLKRISCVEVDAVYENARLPGEFAAFTPMKDSKIFSKLADKKWQSNNVRFDYTAIHDSLESYNASSNSYKVFGKEYKPYTSKYFLNAWDELRFTYIDFGAGRSTLQLESIVGINDQTGQTKFNHKTSITGRLVIRELRIDGAVSSIVVWLAPTLPEVSKEFVGDETVKLLTIDPAITGAKSIDNLLTSTFKPGQCFTEGTTNSCELNKSLVYSIASEGSYVRVKFYNNGTIALSISDKIKQVYRTVSE